MICIDWSILKKRKTFQTSRLKLRGLISQKKKYFVYKRNCTQQASSENRVNLLGNKQTNKQGKFVARHCLNLERKGSRRMYPRFCWIYKFTILGFKTSHGVKFPTYTWRSVSRLGEGNGATHERSSKFFTSL